MKMFYSKKGIPVIELNENIKILLSLNTANFEGVRWAVISGMGEIETKIKKGKKVISIVDSQGFSIAVDLKFRKIPKDIKTHIPVEELKKLNKILEPLLTGDEILPFSKIKDVENKINGVKNTRKKVKK